MKHIWKKLFILVIFTVISLVFASGVHALSNYTIEGYHIDIDVNENNTFYITETIDVYFNIPQHGIYRDIPLNNTVDRLDGTSSKNRAAVSDISVSEKYSSSSLSSGGNRYKRLQIGDANIYVSGDHTYVIQYLYNLGKDPSPDYDEFYLNIIGPEWDNTVINNITFTVNMPKEFDAEKLGFSSGRIGSTDSSNVYYSVSGNTITGGHIGSLVSGEALTIRLELPEGYFVGASSIADIFKYLIPVVFVIILLLTAGIIIIRLKWGWDGHIVEPVEFYPPDQLNSVDVGFTYHGRVAAKEFTSLFIYLANKGYIEIDEVQSTTERRTFGRSVISNSTTTLLKKKKEYDGDNDMERAFMDAVFKHRDQVFLSSLTTSGPESAEFAKAIRQLMREGNKKEKRLTIFDAASMKMRKLGSLLLLITIALYGLFSFMMLDGDVMGIFLAFISMFPIVILSIAIKTGLSLITGPRTNIISRCITIVFMLFMFFFISKSLQLFSLSGPLLEGAAYPVLFILAVFTVMLAVSFAGGHDKRNIYGRALYGRIKGFRNFLLTAEKHKLETLVMDDPSYFYNILPYTYVLNVSKKWIEKFEMINLDPPDWYHSTDSTFNTAVFCKSIDSIMSSANETISPSSSGDSGSGGSSGGGSSGGGSGGGGGGSW